MKPTIALLALLSALSLTACTGTQAPSAATQDTPALGQEETQKTAAPILLYREQSYDYHNDEQELLGTVTKGHLELYGDLPSLSAMQAVLDEKFDAGISYSTEQENGTLEDWLDMAQTTLDTMRETEAYEYWGGLAESYEPQPTRVDEAVVSIVENLYSYTGGAHGWSGIRGFTMDTATGEVLTLERLSADGAQLQELCRQKVLAQMEQMVQQEEYYLFDGYQDCVDQIVAEGRWYLNDEGIVFVAELYLIGPYAMGMTEFLIPYSELEGLLRTEYFPAPASEAVVVPSVQYWSTDASSSQVYTVGEPEESGAVLSFDAAAQNVRVSEVGYSDYTGEQGSYYELSTLFWAAELPEGSVLHLTGEIPEACPNRKVSWESGGVLRNGYLTYNGDTGELFLMELSEEE